MGPTVRAPPEGHREHSRVPNLLFHLCSWEIKTPACLHYAGIQMTRVATWTRGWAGADQSGREGLGVQLAEDTADSESRSGTRAPGATRGPDTSQASQGSQGRPRGGQRQEREQERLGCGDGAAGVPDQARPKGGQEVNEQRSGARRPHGARGPQHHFSPNGHNLGRPLLWPGSLPHGFGC